MFLLSWIIALCFISGLSADEYYGASRGFRTKLPRSALRRNTRLVSSASLRRPIVDSLFSKEKDAIEGFKSEGEQKIKDKISEAQNNMLQMWNAYNEGMKSTSKKMKTLMSSFGLPSKYLEDSYFDNGDNDDDDGGGGIFSRFVPEKKIPRKSITTRRIDDDDYEDSIGGKGKVSKTFSEVATPRKVAAQKGTFVASMEYAYSMED